ncbi:MAG: flagellar basal body rod protein FlgC [Clostridiales bacterium]
MAFLNSLDIVGSALTAQRYRSDIILQNMANAKTTRTAAGGPYRRKQVVFEERPLGFRESFAHARSRYNTLASTGGVRVQEMVDSTNELKPVYDPQHPDADGDGYVWYPNVDTTEEMVDLMAASNSYEANLTAMSVVKAMIAKSLEVGRS